MKKLYIVFLITFIALSFKAHTQTVNIPDSIFKAYLLADTAINTNRDTAIQVSEAVAFTGKINVFLLGIKDLTGIEAFTSLKRLECSSNPLKNLNISYNTSLDSLSCYFDSLASLDVSSNVRLTYLNCRYNKLTTLDVSSDTALVSLTCADNIIDSLDFSSNKALNYLFCTSDSLRRLNVSSNSGLTYLACGYSNLTSLDVSSNTALTLLNCYQNKLTTLDVSADTALTTLICSANNLKSLNVKNGNNHNITYFQAADNPGLTCIQVDDSAYSDSAWTNKDSWARFSNDCHYVGISEMKSINNINIYPNPLTTKLVIESKGHQMVSVSIYNTLGQIINAQKVLGNPAIIDMSGVSSGIFYIRIKIEDERTIIKKVVKQ